MAADLRGVNTLMLDFHDDPEFVSELFEFVVAMEVAFARAQVEAGADLIGIGDAAASLIGPRLYDRVRRCPTRRSWSPRSRRWAPGSGCTSAATRGRSSRGMGSLGCDIVDLDFLSPMAEGRAAMGPDQVLLGNIDPVRRAPRRDAGSDHPAARRVLPRPPGPRYIVAAGCEVPRGTPAENLRALTEFARSHQP